MSLQAIMGVDIGTTGCRAVIYTRDGSALANQSLEYPLYTPKPGWAEQEPEEIYHAFVRVVRQAVFQAGLKPGGIAGICFSSVMHSVIPVDASGNALYRMLIWADSRSNQYTEMLKSGEYEGKSIYARTGCPLHPLYPLSKVVWFKEERPDIFKKTAKFISIKEYILYRLLGKYVVDKSIASATGMYNIHKQEWDKDILNILGIGEDRLSPVMSTTHVEPNVLPEAAGVLGISPDTAVVLGASDGVLSNVGAGAVNPGQLTAMIGTSGAVRAVTAKPHVDEKGRTWCYNLMDNYWVIGGATNNGGIIYRWIRDRFGESERYEAEQSGLDPFDVLSRYAELKPAGADGLILLPFFSGERAPYYNANARGVLFGLNLNHDKHHLVRAALEGVVYSMYSIFKALEEVSGNVNEIRVSGSFTRSRGWVQMMADVFGRAISVPGEPEGAAFGAAVLGMHALGIFKDIKEVRNLMHIKESYYPVEENHKRYQSLFGIYERIYCNLLKEFDEIAELQRTWQNP